MQRGVRAFVQRKCMFYYAIACPIFLCIAIHSERGAGFALYMYTRAHPYEMSLAEMRGDGAHLGIPNS